VSGRLRAGCAILAALIAAACARAGTPASRAGERNPWTVPGVLRVGADEEPDGLNLMFAHSAASDAISGLLFSFILRYDRNGNYVPDLATDVPSPRNGGISRDGKTIVVHLRKGVVWADGAPLTAADWLFTYRAVLNPRNNVKTRYGWDAIASAAAPDPYTIVIRLKRPDVTAFGILAMGGAGYPPLPAHLLASQRDLNASDFNDRPLSSGPYVLRAWNRGTSLVFAPNPRYFRGAPKLKEIEWKIVPDVNTLFNQLRTHEIDVYPSVDANSVPQLAGIAGIVVKRQLLANWRHLGINTSRPLLRDVRVRRAIAEAIDWKRIDDTVYHGINRLAVSDIFPESWAAPSLAPYAYDPAGARHLLYAAGWRMQPDGVLHDGPSAMQLTVSATIGHQENEQSEVLMQSMLKPFGIDLQIRNYPANLMFAQNGPLYTGKYDLEWSVETNGPDPDNAGSWNGAFIPPKGANTSWLDDPVVNATSTAAERTFDQARRKALYQIEERRLREVVPAVVFTWETGYAAMNSDVRNYIPAAFIGDTWNAWQWNV
jgi:peptide/nickel transport system substrate-binding protein